VDVIPVLDQILAIATPAGTIVIVTRKPVFVNVMQTGLAPVVIYTTEHAPATVIVAMNLELVFSVQLLRQWTRNMKQVLISELVHVMTAMEENVADIWAHALANVTHALDLRAINAQNAQLTLTGIMELASVMIRLDSSMSMDAAYTKDLVTVTVMVPDVVVPALRTVMPVLATHCATVTENVDVMITGTTIQIMKMPAAPPTLDLVTGDVLLVLDPQTWTVLLVVETPKMLEQAASALKTGQVNIVIPGTDHVIVIVLAVVMEMVKNTVTPVDLTHIV